MTGRNTPSLPTTTATTRRQALDTRSRRVRRALRSRTALVVGGAAALALVGGVATIGTQPAIGDAFGIATPSASASAAPALRGASLDKAQAAATIVTAQTVLADANDKTDTAALEQQVQALSDYRSMSSGAITSHIASTVDATTEVADASAAQDKADADEQARAAAAAKAAAEQAAAAAEAARAQAAANTPAGAKATAAQLASSQYGWGSAQFQCLDSLWTKESGWNYQAVNANGGATGIPQALPGSKMATIAADWRTNATTQVKWGLQYISSAYGTPCAAWAHSQANNFY
ncbi:aggregation-promoting factor C-terminal-like domain-containing protein [Curtobacterium citreum]|uniref:aggregation-promoting factor C-terminal-like domain-containing protein n=1 Tax=Curtobacterium citreum TaxID=2036 RepID=UPI00254377D4|nr:phospholipase [Curtobacterium citreum]WIJ44448.1 phospholipase [Curtobacterium citreum]